MRKILFACALLFVAVMSANAQFFSVNLGDSKETVKTKMVKAGFWLYEDDGDLTFFQDAMNDEGEVIRKLPDIDGLIITAVTASFSKGKLSLIIFSDIQIYDPHFSSQLTPSQEVLKWRIFEDSLFNRTNLKYRDFEFAKSKTHNKGTLLTSLFISKKREEAIGISWHSDSSTGSEEVSLMWCTLESLGM